MGNKNIEKIVFGVIFLLIGLATPVLGVELEVYEKNYLTLGTFIMTIASVLNTPINKNKKNKRILFLDEFCKLSQWALYIFGFAIIIASQFLNNLKWYYNSIIRLNGSMLVLLSVGVLFFSMVLNSSSIDVRMKELAELQDVQNELQQKELENKELQTELDAKKKESKNLQIKLDENHTQNDNLQTELDEVKRKLNDKEAQNEKLQTKLEKVEMELANERRLKIYGGDNNCSHLLIDRNNRITLDKDTYNGPYSPSVSVAGGGKLLNSLMANKDILK